MARDLRDMAIAITGASAGIGLELARQLAAQGARLALCARRVDRLREVAGELGGNPLTFQADVGRPEDCQAFVAAATRHLGRLDTLVCNAGYGIYKRVDETDADEARQMLDVNVLGTTECIRHAVPIMSSQIAVAGWRGQIVVVSSGAARRGTPFIGVYSGTKAAQLAIAEALRVELADSRIAVTTIHPTPTKSEFRQVAEKMGKYSLPSSSGFIKTQTATEVAAAIVRAIRRPRPEVWPWRLAGCVLGIGTLAPRLMDRLMYRYYDRVLRHNRLR